MTTSILHLQASPRAEDSFSRRFSTELVQRLRRGNEATRVTVRDLAADPPPFVDEAFSAAILGNHAADDPAFAVSEILIRELQACDTVVISTSMHNYGVPAVLKAWVDQVVRIHRSFRGTPAGKIGLLPDRPVWLVVASGGWFTAPASDARDAPPTQPDFLTPYLRAVLATIGLSDVRLITLEGMSRGLQAQENALARARAALDRLLPNRDLLPSQT